MLKKKTEIILTFLLVIFSLLVFSKNFYNEILQKYVNKIPQKTLLIPSDMRGFFDAHNSTYTPPHRVLVIFMVRR